MYKCANMSQNRCGISCWHPIWLQKFANIKWFTLVYGLLGTVQGISSMYIVITLTTMEKRFKIKSQTTGFILSGNEISQILLSLILTYYGGQRNRPKWIGYGVVFSAFSCFILALPHFLYGAGDEALQYTKEYLHEQQNNSTELLPMSIDFKRRKLCKNSPELVNERELFSYVPLLLIFFSQFVLGIGNTLYYSLGQSYIDDNIKQRNTPIVLSYAFTLRLCGSVVGIGLAYVTSRIYIDPTLTPMISPNDPRWLGAWWLGWIILGVLMFIFAGLIALFPQNLPRKKRMKNVAIDTRQFGEKLEDGRHTDFRDFPKALMRLLTNKVLMFNNISSIFYILGASGFITYLGKIMEIQFNRTSAGGTAFSGPVKIIGIAIGFLTSGHLITKYKPVAKYLFFWNVIVGLIGVCCKISYTQLGCGSNNPLIINGSIVSCNSNCICDGITYSPVCDRLTSTTYFSPCHSGCKSFDVAQNIYTNCTCPDYAVGGHVVSPGACNDDCTTHFYIFTLVLMLNSFISSTGKIGNVLLNFRSVETQDKAFAQGLSLFLFSLFALIPGPIYYGRVIDNACLIWNSSSGREGNCQLYDPVKFRYLLHSNSAFFIFLATFFDFLVWYFARNLELYGDADEKPNQIEKGTNEPVESEPLKNRTLESHSEEIN